MDYTFTLTFYRADATTEALEERRDQEEDPMIIVRPDTKDVVPEPTSVTYTDYDDPFSFVDQSSGAPQIRKMSNYAWVGCGGDIYVLDCLGKGYIRIEEVKNEDKEGLDISVYVELIILLTRIAQGIIGRRYLHLQHFRWQLLWVSRYLLTSVAEKSLRHMI